MTPIIITLSLLIHSQLSRKNSGTDLGTGYGGTVCGFHTRPIVILRCFGALSGETTLLFFNVVSHIGWVIS